jgi:hypothetical protein
MTEEGRAIEPLGEAGENSVADLSQSVDRLSEQTVVGHAEGTLTGVPEETVEGVPEETVEGVPEETVEGVPEETVEGLPVLADVRPIDRTPPAALPAVQTAAAVATGFVAGAATFALVKRHNTRRSVRAARSAPRRAVDMLPIVGSRTFLVDIHLIGKPGE